MMASGGFILAFNKIFFRIFVNNLIYICIKTILRHSVLNDDLFLKKIPAIHFYIEKLPTIHFIVELPKIHFIAK